MANENKRPWYRNPVYLSIIGAVLAAIIGATWTFLLNQPDGFSIAINPMHGAVEHGGVITTAITINGIYGYDHTVSLSASGQPSGMVIAFVPPSEKPSYTSNIMINVDSNVPVGDYTIIINARGADGKEDSCKYTLTVKPFPLTPTHTITPPPTITPTPTPKVWEIGYNDSSYGEFDPLKEYPDSFPWHYNISEPPDKFPKEINDFARKPINIHFYLCDEQSKNDILLTLDAHSVHGPDFSVLIKTQISEVGTYTFDNVNKTHKIIIKKDLVSSGENTIILDCASPLKTNRWLFWDYLSLKAYG